MWTVLRRYCGGASVNLIPNPTPLRFCACALVIVVCLDARTHPSQLLDKLYALKGQIYYLSYPMKIYYISEPSEEPADYAEKVPACFSFFNTLICWGLQR